MGFGAEILFILLLGLLVLGPKRLHTVLADVARAKARFEEASRGFKSQLTAELEAASQRPGNEEHSPLLATENSIELPTPARSGATTRWQRGSPANDRLHRRSAFEFHVECGCRRASDACLVANPSDRGGSSCPKIAATTSRVGWIRCGRHRE